MEQKRIQNLSLGTSDFSALRLADEIYVDKTYLVHELASKRRKYFLARPRRFGKSLLISTFESLFRYGLRDFKGFGYWEVLDWRVKTSCGEAWLFWGEIFFFAGRVFEEIGLTHFQKFWFRRLSLYLRFSRKYFPSVVWMDEDPRWKVGEAIDFGLRKTGVTPCFQDFPICHPTLWHEKLYRQI